MGKNELSLNIQKIRTFDRKAVIEPGFEKQHHEANTSAFDVSSQNASGALN